MRPACREDVCRLSYKSKELHYREVLYENTSKLSSILLLWKEITYDSAYPVGVRALSCHAGCIDLDAQGRAWPSVLKVLPR